LPGVLFYKSTDYASLSNVYRKKGQVGGFETGFVTLSASWGIRNGFCDAFRRIPKRNEGLQLHSSIANISVLEFREWCEDLLMVSVTLELMGAPVTAQPFPATCYIEVTREVL